MELKPKNTSFRDQAGKTVKMRLKKKGLLVWQMFREETLKETIPSMTVLIGDGLSVQTVKNCSVRIKWLATVDLVV